MLKGAATAFTNVPRPTGLITSTFPIHPNEPAKISTKCQSHTCEIDGDIL